MTSLDTLDEHSNCNIVSNHDVNKGKDAICTQRECTSHYEYLGSVLRA